MATRDLPRRCDRMVAALALTSSIAVGAAAEEQSAAPGLVDFERHVAPLFGRFGCNSAACHGALSGGKGGMQLSLFGHSAAMDYHAVASRIDRDRVGSSLLLLKPSGEEEHEGGVRFQPGSHPYRTVRRWIARGATWERGSGVVERLSVRPHEIVLGADETPAIQLRVIARFADGSEEDVTGLCQFSSRDEGVAVVEPGGRVTRSGHGDTSVVVSYSNAFGSVGVLVPHHANGDRTAIEANDANFIDTHIRRKLARLNLVPSDACTDEQFLRRVMIDTIGTIPTPGQVESFRADARVDKRERKIDELLAHPMHAALWATRMCDITKCDVRSMGDDDLLAARRAQMWHDWFRKRFADNVAYDAIVRGIVTATSREARSARDWVLEDEELIRAGGNSLAQRYADRETLDLYWRRVDPDTEARLKLSAELTAVAFTGVRLNCAQCHKHPFDRWTQNDYTAFANIFSRVVCGTSTETNAAIFEELAKRRELRRMGESTTGLPRMREIFVSSERGRPLGGAALKAFPPRPLGGPGFDPDRDLRQQFFDWLVSADNRYFAPSFANRVWAVYFGIGLVDPVDDFSVTNPPSHPALLDRLATSFGESGYDIRKLERQILRSAAYQRSAAPNESNRDDRRNYTRQLVRPLLAEVAVDAINAALGVEENFGDLVPRGSLAIEVGTNVLQGDVGRTLKVLGRGERESTCDCDRREHSDLRQAIFLISDRVILTKIQSGTLRSLLSHDDRDLVERLYLRMLGRRPDADETRIGVRHLSSDADRERAFEDLVWGLLNTREFITNH